jgi:anti-sigma factor RsiW
VTERMDKTDYGCQIEEVAAYLDGELAAAGQARFEQHVKACSTCANELRAQRQLLCTLDVAFNDSRSFDLPQNFARVVTASAENDLSMIRHGRERRRALQLCGLLGLISFALLGAATRTVVVDPLRSIFRTTRVLFDLLFQALSDAASTASVVVRMVARAQPASRLVLTLGLVASLCCLSLLIAKYRRAQIIE